MSTQWGAQAAAATRRRLRKPAKATPPKPINIIAQVEASGTEPVSETSLTSANGGTGRLPAARNESVSLVASAVIFVEKVSQPENPWLGSEKPPGGNAEGSVPVNEPRLAVSDWTVSPRSLAVARRRS